MYGTGTQAGDAVELKSALDVFAPGKRGPEYPLYLGSVKANVGYVESGSGVTSLIKVLKMMEESDTAILWHQIEDQPQFSYGSRGKKCYYSIEAYSMEPS